MSTTGSFAGSARVNLQVLTGQDNYNRRIRNFKLVATAEEVWDFYEGTADILAKPDRDNYGIPKAKKKRNIAHADIASASTDEIAQSANVLKEASYCLNISSPMGPSSYTWDAGRV